MSIEGDLLRLARDRDAATEAAVNGMLLETPDSVRRQLRAYLSRQVDCGRIKRTNEKIPQLMTLEEGINQLACPGVQFSSGARLTFDIQLEKRQAGWFVRQFRFNVSLPRPRSIRMVRIHLKPETWYDPLAVPRCHLHVDNSQAHVPFPVMDPRLMLHVICEHVEPHLGI
jgi:hypothetical protein